MASPSSEDVAQLSGELYRPYDLEFYSMSLLVIGASGTGKSMFCNFLAHSKDVFSEACGVESVTDRVEHCVQNFSDEKLLIVDSPGFCDPIKTDQELIMEISETAILTRDGVDVVGVLVNPCSRFSTTNKKALEAINSLGGNMWKHSFIIFNNAAKIENKFKKMPEDYIEYLRSSEKTPKELKEMLELANGRYICVESVDWWENDNYWQDKSREVIEMIRKLKHENKGIRYKNSIMSMGVEGYEIIQKLKKENYETKEQVKKLNEELETQRMIEDQTKDQVGKQENMIKVLEKKIANLEENGLKKNEEIAMNDMQKLFANMMEEFHTMQAKQMQNMQTAQQQASMQVAQMQAAQQAASAQMQQMQQMKQMQAAQTQAQHRPSTPPREPEPKKEEGSGCCVM